MSEHMLWVEKYRPHKVEDCILPDAMKVIFLEYVNKKQIPNLLLSGTAGVGKTTIAKAMCDEVGCDYLVINGSDDRGIATMQNQVKNYATSMSLAGGRKVVIIDEADNLTPDAQKALRGIMENVSDNCSFIFTCNYKNRIMDAIHSRCSVVDFKTTGNKAALATQFMKRVEQILTLEGIPFQKDVVATVIMKYFPDNRRTLNELQRYAMTGAIDAGILASVSEVQLSELVDALKAREFKNVRKWITNNLDQEPVRIFRSLYDTLSEKLKPNSIPQLVLILAKYQYQAAFVADHEINLMACMTEIMVECEFK